MNYLKKTQTQFWIWFSVFAFISGLVILLKKAFMFQDVVSRTNFILSVSPLILLFAIIAAYAIYDRMAKSSKQSQDETLQWQLFYKAHNYKILLITLGGIFMALTLLLYWKQDYLWLLGFSLIFYLLAYPTQLKFDQYFSDNLDKRYEQRAAQRQKAESEAHSRQTQKESKQ